MAKKRKGSRAMPRGSSKAGRPRKDGVRYADGRLRPPGPNQIVVENRRALLGDSNLDIATASDPVDFAHAKGWLSDRDHQSANALFSLYRRAGFSAPRMGTGTLHEVQPALQIDARSFATMSDEEIGQLWDAVFHDEPPPAGTEDPGIAALQLWNEVMRRLPKPMQSEVFSICIAKSWPQWVIVEAAGKALSQGQAERKASLLSGLALFRSVNKSRRKAAAEPATPRVSVEPIPCGAGRKVEERTVYVTPTGETVLEVVRRRRVRS